jgi:RNA polymerase sigma-70 factor (ECF subfamily)
MPRSDHDDWAKYEPGLRRFIRRRVTATAVDDVVQEVWVRLCSMRDPSAIRDMERYLFVVASSVLSLHRKREQPQVGFDAVAEAALPVDNISPERALLAKDRVEQILQVIEGLPCQTKHIFMLHRFEEMTYPRIAHELGVSVSAIEKHMIKALRALIASEREAI